MSNKVSRDPLDGPTRGIDAAGSPAGGAELKVGHLSVMADEVLETLAPRPGSLQIDATLGGAGHAERILEASAPDGRLLGVDADPAAIARSARRLARFGDRVVLQQANFGRLAEVAPAAGFREVDGLLLDLGLSSYQLADVERGFGFRAGGRLDMRFDTSRGRPAADLLAELDAGELAALFRRYGEEPFAGRIARAIVESRRDAPVETAEQLAVLVERAVPTPKGRRTHPATRVFQALARTASPRRAPGRSELPLARRSHRQALHRRRAAGLRLPAPGADLRLRSQAGASVSRQVADAECR
jgi:16S rRNA (cytosine1402-N4)-methyltransferase